MYMAGVRHVRSVRGRIGPPILGAAILMSLNYMICIGQNIHVINICNGNIFNGKQT